MQAFIINRRMDVRGLKVSFPQIFILDELVAGDIMSLAKVSASKL